MSMIRRLVSLFFLSILFWGCPPLPHHYVPVYKIEYQSSGRGGSEYIVLEKGTLKYVENRQDTIVKRLRNKHYKTLHAYLTHINLDSLSLLKVPSKKHRSDGAWITNFSVTDPRPNVYVSLPFDHDNPPEKIKGIIEYIKKISKK